MKHVLEDVYVFTGIDPKVDKPVVQIDLNTDWLTLSPQQAIYFGILLKQRGENALAGQECSELVRGYKEEIFNGN